MKTAVRELTGSQTHLKANINQIITVKGYLKTKFNLSSYRFKDVYVFASKYGIEWSLPNFGSGCINFIKIDRT